MAVSLNPFLNMQIVPGIDPLDDHRECLALFCVASKKTAGLDDFFIDHKRGNFILHKLARSFPLQAFAFRGASGEPPRRDSRLRGLPCSLPPQDIE